MKKMMFMVMAAMAISFTSCGNKAQQAAPADEVATVEAVDVESAISEATSQLTEQIEAQDAGKLQQAIEAVQAKVAEILAKNPEAAKEFVTKVQSFLKENAEKIKAVAGDNTAIQSAFAALTDAPAESIISGLSNMVGDVKDAANAATDAAEGAVDAAKSATEDAVDAAKQAAEDKANEVKDAAKEKAGEAVDAAADKAKKALGL